MTESTTARTLGRVIESLQHRARIGLCFLDADLHYVWVNDAFAAMVGYGADELVGMAAAAVTHADDVALVDRLAERARRGELSHFTSRNRLVRKDGDVVTADVLLSMVDDEDGTSIGGFATVVPIAA